MDIKRLLTALLLSFIFIVTWNVFFPPATQTVSTTNAKQEKPFDKDLYTLSENEVKKISTVCGSLREAMQSLDQDRKFLTQGGVFTDDQIDAYIDLKFQEIYKFEHTPHPIEFEMYYSG